MVSLVFLLLPYLVSCLDTWSYTEETFTLSGEPCMSDCVQRKCIVNWKGHRKTCRPTGKPSPIYRTAEKKNTLKYCLSNCHTYGYSYEWCIVDERKYWDYCSSNIRGDIYTVGHIAAARTTRKVDCRGYAEQYCLKNKGTYYYWCITDKSNHWDYCAPAGSRRIPMLSIDFRIGGYYNDYLETATSEFNSTFYTSLLPDDYLEDIKLVLQDAYTSVVRKISDPTAWFTDYKITVVDLPKKLSVPVILEADVTHKSIKNGKIDISTPIRKHLKEMKKADDAVFNYDEIDHDEIDFVANTPLFETKHWVEYEKTVNSLVDRNGYLKLLVVIFYSDYEDPVPLAFGVSLSMYTKNGDLVKRYIGNLFFNREPPPGYILR